MSYGWQAALRTGEALALLAQKGANRRSQPRKTQRLSTEWAVRRLQTRWVVSKADAGSDTLCG